ncbi:enoyl-CoA hydratase/carnithine racemase [Embleya sp. AB8]
MDRVVPTEEVCAEAVKWAGQFANGPAYALRAAEEAIDRGLEVDLNTGLELERLQFTALFATEDRAAGMRAFMAKEKPKFSGR